MPLPIEDYAMIGDREAARLGRRATARSIGCAGPDSIRACFAALLATESTENGGSPR